MQLQTIVDIHPSKWKIMPTDRLLFVGSCFADNIGAKFAADHFQTVVNPYGVMYNPESILHTLSGEPYPEVAAETANLLCDVAVLTLGTNHIYVEKATGKAVDNCMKRPQRLFEEKILDVDACADTLRKAIGCVLRRNPSARIVLTVSPIRYRKYGYHASQLSKSTLLLAVEEVVSTYHNPAICYFPSYEIVMDELRDYRFYEPDMLHPSAQCVDYIYERFRKTFFSAEAETMVEEWRPIREALNHRPFHPESEEYKAFLCDAEARKEAFERKYSNSAQP